MTRRKRACPTLAVAVAVLVGTNLLGARSTEAGLLALGGTRGPCACAACDRLGLGLGGTYTFQAGDAAWRLRLELDYFEDTWLGAFSVAAGGEAALPSAAAIRPFVQSSFIFFHLLDFGVGYAAELRDASSNRHNIYLIMGVQIPALVLGDHSFWLDLVYRPTASFDGGDSAFRDEVGVVLRWSMLPPFPRSPWESK